MSRCTWGRDWIVLALVRQVAFKVDEQGHFLLEFCRVVLEQVFLIDVFSLHFLYVVKLFFAQ